LCVPPPLIAATTQDAGDKQDISDHGEGAGEGRGAAERGDETCAQKGSLDYSTDMALLVEVTIREGDKEYVGGLADGWSEESKARRQRLNAEVFAAVGNCDLDMLDELRDSQVILLEFQ
jgi:hypothetical protein